MNGFRSYLIFYRPTEKGVTILHVVHGASDLESRFGPRDDDEGRDPP